MNIQSIQTQQTLSKSLQFIELSEHFSVYRWEAQVQSAPDTAFVSVICDERYALTKDVREAAANMESHAGVFCPIKNLPHGVKLLPHELVKQAGAYNFHDVYEYAPAKKAALSSRQKENPLGPQMYESLERAKQPFSLYSGLSEQDKDQLGLYLVDSGNYCIYRLGETLQSPLERIRHPLRYEYIHGSVDNAHYDLPALAEHLFGRSDVMLEASPKQAKQAIESIPWFNCEPGRDQYIRFRVLLSDCDFAKVCEQAYGALTLSESGEVKSSKAKYLTSDCMRDAVDKLDLLGMAAFRVARIE